MDSQGTPHSLFQIRHRKKMKQWVLGFNCFLHMSAFLHVCLCTTCMCVVCVDTRAANAQYSWAISPATPSLFKRKMTREKRTVSNQHSCSFLVPPMAMLLRKSRFQSGTEAHACNSSTWRRLTGEFQPTWSTQWDPDSKQQNKGVARWLSH